MTNETLQAAKDFLGGEEPSDLAKEALDKAESWYATELGTNFPKQYILPVLVVSEVVSARLNKGDAPKPKAKAKAKPKAD